jgi:cytochrome c-type biogenesis protein
LDAGAVSLAGAFLVGLAHVFQPCEDKAIVAVFVIWTARKVTTAISLVVLYGLGITAVNTFLGFIFSYAGSGLIERCEIPLKVTAGSVTVGFGLYMLSHFGHLHLEQRERDTQSMIEERQAPGTFHMLGFGLARGMMLCPVELAVLAWALSTGDVLRGTLMLFLFGLGTTISLVPVALLMGGLTVAARKSRYGIWLPRIAPVAMVLMGVVLALSPLVTVEV